MYNQSVLLHHNSNCKPIKACRFSFFFLRNSLSNSIVNFVLSILAGWGTAEEGQSPEEVPDNLQAAELFNVPRNVCAQAHGNTEDGLPRVTENQVCAIDAAEGGNNACNVSIIFHLLN